MRKRPRRRAKAFSGVVFCLTNTRSEKKKTTTSNKTMASSGSKLSLRSGIKLVAAANAVRDTAPEKVTGRILVRCSTSSLQHSTAHHRARLHCTAQHTRRPTTVRFNAHRSTSTRSRRSARPCRPAHLHVRSGGWRARPCGRSRRRRAASCSMRWTRRPTTRSSRQRRRASASVPTRCGRGTPDSCSAARR